MANITLGKCELKLKRVVRLLLIPILCAEASLQWMNAYGFSNDRRVCIKIKCLELKNMKRNVRQCIQFLGCSIVQAVEAASLKPAQVLGIDKQKGTLNFDADADFVMLNDDLTLCSTWIGGKCVYSKQWSCLLFSGHFIPYYYNMSFFRPATTKVALWPAEVIQRKEETNEIVLFTYFNVNSTLFAFLIKKWKEICFFYWFTQFNFMKRFILKNKIKSNEMRKSEKWGILFILLDGYTELKLLFEFYGAVKCHLFNLFFWLVLVLVLPIFIVSDASWMQFYQICMHWIDWIKSLQERKASKHQNENNEKKKIKYPEKKKEKQIEWCG